LAKPRVLNATQPGPIIFKSVWVETLYLTLIHCRAYSVGLFERQSGVQLYNTKQFAFITRLHSPENPSHDPQIARKRLISVFWSIRSEEQHSKTFSTKVETPEVVHLWHKKGWQPMGRNDSNAHKLF